MIELKIKEVAISKGLTTAYQLQKAMGIQPGMAARLWKGEMEMIALKTIDALCEALNCEPSDIIIRLQDKRKKKP